MIQRNMVAIHGGTIVVNNKAIILTGDRGSGKSTLITALRLKGYKFMSDDISSIYMGDTPMIHYGFPYQKLCEDVMDNFDYKKDNYISLHGGEEIKYSIPVLESFVWKNMPLSVIVEISEGNVDAVRIQEIKGGEKINKIIENIYRNEYFDYIGGMDSIYFKKCLEIAQKIKFYKMIRPKYKFTVDNQVEVLQKLLISN